MHTDKIWDKAAEHSFKSRTENAFMWVSAGWIKGEGEREVRIWLNSLLWSLSGCPRLVVLGDWLHAPIYRISL